MPSKNTSILLTVFAGIMILAHLCIPHHYHGSEVCLEHILNIEDPCVHHDIHHNHTGNQDIDEHQQCNHTEGNNHCHGEECIILHTVIVNNNDSLKKRFEQIHDNSDSSDSFKEISATEPFKPELYKPLFSRATLSNETQWIFPDLYIPGANGLRGPPTV